MWVPLLLMSLILFGIILVEVCHYKGGYDEISSSAKAEPSHQKNDTNLASNAGIARRRYPTEEEHRSNEQRFWCGQTRLSIITIALTAIAVLAAGGAYVEAARQVNIAQNALIDENRAFVFFDAPVLNQDPTGGFFHLTVPMGNSGNTPTAHLSYEMVCVLLDAKFQPIDSRGEKGIGLQWAILGPKVTVGPQGCNVKPSEQSGVILSPGFGADFGPSGPTVLIMGRVIYRDQLESLNDPDHITMFCYTMSSFEKTMSGYTEPCRRYNCADAECSIMPWPFPS